MSAFLLFFEMSGDKMKVGYWAIRGLAAPLRMIMVYVDVEFENVAYALHGSAGNWSAPDWFVRLKENF
jgi:hypothetical protein